MTTLPLKSSRNEQCAVIRFLLAKGLKANDIHSLPHPPYSPNLALSDYHLFGPMKKMLGGQKFVSDTEVQSVVRQWLGQQPASFFASGKIKFPTKRIFRIFHILRINGMAPFCNLFMERPSYNCKTIFIL